MSRIVPHSAKLLSPYNESAERAVVRANQVAQLPARVLRRAERMVVRKHPGQEQALGFPDDGPHLEPADTVHPGRHADRFRHRRGLHPRHPCHALAGTRLPTRARPAPRRSSISAAVPGRQQGRGPRKPRGRPPSVPETGQEVQGRPVMPDPPPTSGVREWKAIRSWRRQNSSPHVDCFGAI